MKLDNIFSAEIYIVSTPKNLQSNRPIGCQNIISHIYLSDRV